MSRYFVTATGTDVGKTYVSAALLQGWRAKGLSVAAYKPVVSGFDDANPAGSDPVELLKGLGEEVTPETIAAIAPFRFKPALSPDMAALREGREIPYQQIADQCAEWLNGPQDRILIEGAGGVMVPIDDTHLMRDWMVTLKAPAILVAGSYLGTISHTLTALDSLAAAHIPVAGIIISESEVSPVPVEETINAMLRYVPKQRFFSVPRANPVAEQTALALADFIDAELIDG